MIVFNEHRHFRELIQNVWKLFSAYETLGGGFALQKNTYSKVCTEEPWSSPWESGKKFLLKLIDGSPSKVV